MRWPAMLTGIALLGMAACGASDGERPAMAPDSSTTSVATPSTTATDSPQLAQTCEAERYRVGYPAGWSTNTGDVVPSCRFFDAGPFTVPPATEFLDPAVVFDPEPIPYARLVGSVGGGEEVLDRRETTVAGRPEVRIEARAGNDGALLPPGTASLRYVVDLDGSTLIAATYGVAGADHRRNRDVLDAMMATLEVRTDGCSAAGLRSRPEPQDVPAPVAEMRRSIVAAATACDYERLAELARAGRFTYSFGKDGDPAAFWRREEATADPLRVLVRLLDRPFATRPGGDTAQFVWPRAYAYDSWEEVPPEAREELQPLYGPQDFDRFARAGSYVGHRVGITAEGDWLFFVAGD